jgi:hypothetical protein
MALHANAALFAGTPFEPTGYALGWRQIERPGFANGCADTLRTDINNAIQALITWPRWLSWVQIPSLAPLIDRLHLQCV